MGSVEGRPLGSLRDVWFQGDCEVGTIATKARDQTTWEKWEAL